MLGHSAEQLGVMFQTPASWFREKARLGEIPHVMIGGKYRFTDRHIAEIIELFERPVTGPVATAARRRAKTATPGPSGVTTLTARTPRRRSA